MRALVALVAANAISCSSHKPPRVTPDGGVDAFVVIECDCNVLYQTGCAVGEKCAWVYSGMGPMPPGYVTCVPDGSAPAAAECTYGPYVPDTYPKSCVSGSYDDCVRGTACWNGTCERICDLQMPSCDNGKTCVMHNGLLEYNNVYFGGVCE
jgi:hypothetical protein